MSAESSMLLLGIGTTGCTVARGISRAFGEGLRYALADTDAASGQSGGPFTLLGGDRLSGRGAGGDVVAARMATEDSVRALDTSLEGVRLVVIVTALGGGTGGGATLETVKHLSQRGIPSIVFATTPFSFEGEVRLNKARGVMSMIQDTANATFFLPLDKLVGGLDNMDEAMRRAADTLATAVTLFWRLAQKPGYLRLDPERLRHLIAGAGRGRFATVSVQGANRAAEAVDQLVRAELLTTSNGPIRSILCGVLGGEDLRLSEIGRLADGIKAAFGPTAALEIATVNDEMTFSGRLSIVLMMFEHGNDDTGAADAPAADRRRRPRRAFGRGDAGLKPGPTGRGRFNNAEPTIWAGEDLDIPTFIRKGINLDF